MEGAYALFGSDVSGPTPTPPVILSAPITTNGNVDRVLVGPDPSVVFYVGRPDLETGDQVWRVPLESPGDRVLLAEADELGGILDFVLGPDGSQVLFSALPGWEGQHQLFLADAAAPGAPVHLSAPLEPDEGCGCRSSVRTAAACFTWRAGRSRTRRRSGCCRSTSTRRARWSRCPTRPTASGRRCTSRPSPSEREAAPRQESEAGAGASVMEWPKGHVFQSM
ncbi:hypothetical protein [Nannocystis pusilla]|uniref:hypothetical protein n=1 Tax=Nannocystis pusilla TaxID=889268 RepID=UPI003B7ED89E